MIIQYYKPRKPVLVGDYVPYRDHVVSEGGSIDDTPATQQAFDLLATLPSPVQWLDARFGVLASASAKWYSLTGPATDVEAGDYGSPAFGVDSVSGLPTWAGGAFKGGRTPELDLAANYTWFIGCYVSSGAVGWLWGDRFDQLNQGNAGWNYLSTELWRSYNNNTDAAPAVALPRDQWFRLFIVKDQATVTGYLWVDGQEVVLFSVTLAVPIAALSFGIGGGTDSNGVCPRGVHIQSFARFAAALEPGQRAALAAL